MRVSTYGNYSSALLDLMKAQTRAQEAQERVSTQKVATDLNGFGRGSETLTALKSAESRIQGFIDTGEAVAARLSSQDLAFGRVTDGTLAARDAINSALAAGRLDGLMLELQAQFGVVQDGLNTKHQGRYLFGGGNLNEAPVRPLSLGQLASGTTADAFANDDLKQVSRLDEGTSMQTGFLADETATALFDVFRDIQLFNQATPLTGQPTDAMRDFLTAAVNRLNTEYTNLTDLAAQNGAMQNRVDQILKSQQAQQQQLTELLSDRTDADMAEALTDLQLSQTAIQASAQVIAQLRETSLLNYLR